MIQVGQILQTKGPKDICFVVSKSKRGWRLQFIQPNDMSYQDFKLWDKMKSGIYSERVINLAFEPATEEVYKFHYDPTNQ